MPTAHLIDRAFIDVTGPEARHFLQNILTVDVEAVGAGEVRPGALLSPQGKILFDFLISTLPDGYRLDCRRALAEDFARRLTLYRLRAKVGIAVVDQAVVAVRWQGDSSDSRADSGASRTDSTASRTDSGLGDTRFPAAAGVVRFHDAVPAADADEAEWHALRAAYGIAESGSDFEPGDAFPHDVLLDQTGGVGFRKGCYVGQEVVSRMQHRGTARRRVLLATATGLPEPGTEITAGGRAIGRLGTVSGDRGLAIVRIDRVKEAMEAGTPILAGAVPVALAIPSWAGFDYPAAAPAEEG